MKANAMSDRLLILNLGKPSRLLSVDADGGSLTMVDSDLGVAPDGIAIDHVHRTIFWTYMGSSHDGEDFLAADGSLHRMDFDGGNRRMVVPTGATTTPKQMQCDAEHGFLYWCDREGMRVMRSRLDGSQITTLVQTGATDADRADRRRHCVGIAVDRAGGHLYWTQKGPPNGGAGRILRAPLDLPPGADPARRNDIETLFDQLPEPIDLEWDGAASELYWTDRGDPPAGNTLNRVRVAPGEPLVPEVVLAGLKEAIGLALDRRHRRAYVGDLSGTIHRVSLDRPHSAEVVFSGQGAITGIAYLAG